MKIQVQIRFRFHRGHRKFATTMACCLGLAFLPACKSHPIESQQYTGRPLEADTVVAVGQRSLARGQLQVVAGKSLDLGEFVRGWVVDALVSEGSRNGLLESTRVRQTERSVLARALLEWTYN